MLEDGNCSGIYKVDMLIGKFEQIIRGFFSARKKDPTDIGSFLRVDFFQMLLRKTEPQCM